MNNPFIALVIFIIILFFYIHITAQWKTSDDLEIYESDFESPAHLQEVCSVKQPVLIKNLSKNPNAAPFFERFQTANFEKYDNLDVLIKDRSDYSQLNSVDSIPLSFRSARHLLKSDTNSKYFSEKNQEFLEESGVDRFAEPLDDFLKPPLTAYKKYDLLFGSPLAASPLRYHLESHRFFAVTRGKIRVRLCPPKYGRLLPLVADYENYEFFAKVDAWTTGPENRDLLQKIKFLDVDVQSGDVLFVPPYWWYSISFSGDPETTVASLAYDAAMNVLAQSKHWSLYYLQQSNIKTRPAKTLVPALDSAVNQSSPDADKTSQPIQEKTQEESFAQPKNKEIVTNAGTYVVD